MEEGVSVEIVRRIQDGDQQAWNELYRRYHDELLFAVRCRLGPGLRAHLQSEDVLQSVMLDALDDLEDFVPRGSSSVKHFLHVLITNKIRDRVDTFAAKKRKGTVALTDSVMAAVPGFEGDVRYHDEQRFDALERCVAKLPEEMRQVILLRKVEGLSGREAAEIMGKEEAATRKLFSRAMARLTTLMRDPA